MRGLTACALNTARAETYTAVTEEGVASAHPVDTAAADKLSQMRLSVDVKLWVHP